MKGKIVKIYGRYYSVNLNDKILPSFLKGSIRKDERNKKYSDPAAVGDFVEIELNADGTASINEILPRKNMFSRKDGTSVKEDVIAANIDLVVAVQCFGDPAFNPRFVDRLAVRAMMDEIPLILCMNKYDLADDYTCQYANEYYKKTDVKIVYVSAEEGSGIDEFRKLLKNKISIFAGYSGVGKSSLLNALFPDAQLPTSTVSESTGKGRHTTTNVEMIFTDEHTALIDTPGMREFGLPEMEPEELSNYFYEFETNERKCKFFPCTHDHEPGCEIKARVDLGEISEGRYISYLNILESLRYNKNNKYRTSLR
jgi:ribosome biogenesis GTPase